MSIQGRRSLYRRCSGEAQPSDGVGEKRRKEGKSGWRTGRGEKTSRKPDRKTAAGRTGAFELVGEADADFVRDFESLLDTSPDRGSVEIVPRQIQAGKGGATVVDRGQPGGVAQIVLRKGAWPDADVREYGALAKLHQRLDFAMNKGDQLVGRLFCGVGIGCAADKACQQDVVSGGTAGKK